ncbi:MAG: TraR/DksA C4-type zinc finger protein [Armatimonadetes bacterium]|nr:TraR/DksA C4-type zinc finger protein [Armatimonadota bacterium]
MTAKPRIKIEKYRDLLLKQKEELLAELRRLEDRAAGRDGEQETVAGEDFDEPGGDAALDTAERDQARVMAREVREILDLVDQALARIEAGKYGVCEVCGAPIPAARLQLIPWAARCAKCASATTARTR